MTRNEYMEQLKRYLRRLPKEDYENAVEYFSEYFDEAGPENEQQMMKDLGDPKEAAREVLLNLLEESVENGSAEEASRTETVKTETLPWKDHTACIPGDLCIAGKYRTSDRRPCSAGGCCTGDRSGDLFPGSDQHCHHSRRNYGSWFWCDTDYAFAGSSLHDGWRRFSAGRSRNSVRRSYRIYL